MAANKKSTGKERLQAVSADGGWGREGRADNVHWTKGVCQAR